MANANVDCKGSSSFKYSKPFMIALRKKYLDPPVRGFHPVYIKQKRVQISKGGANTGKWGELEKIRAFTSNENSFIKRSRNKTETEVIIGEFRNLLNKLTSKTAQLISDKIQSLDLNDLDDEDIKTITKVFVNKSVVDKNYGEVYSNIAVIICKKIKEFDKFMFDITTSIFDKFTASVAKEHPDNIDNIQKLKIIGILRTIPYFIGQNVYTHEHVKEKILKTIIHNLEVLASEECKKSKECKQRSIYVELLCVYCEHYVRAVRNVDTMRTTEMLDVKEYINRLEMLKSMKKIPARIRFMVDDTLKEIL